MRDVILGRYVPKRCGLFGVILGRYDSTECDMADVIFGCSDSKVHSTVYSKGCDLAYVKDGNVS